MWLLIEDARGFQHCYAGEWLSSIDDLKRAFRRNKRRVVAVYRLRKPRPA